MELKELQDKISDIFISNLKRDNIKIDDDYLIMKISEELGEFIQSYLVHKKLCRPEKYLSGAESKLEMSKELADIIGLAFMISKEFDINLEEALVKKWISREWVKKK